MHELREANWWTHTGDEVLHEELDLHPWLLSATDLLVAWAPEERWIGAAPDVARREWDRYFEPRAVVAAEPAEPQSDRWDAEAAEQAVDTLYRFLHAIERCDIAGAMECVAADFQAVENEREIDRDGLRLQLESSIEAWRAERFRITLTEIPDPFFHPSGILLRVTMQIDFWSRAHLRNLTELLGRVLWFRVHTDGRWLLAGMATTN